MTPKEFLNPLQVFEWFEMIEELVDRKRDGWKNFLTGIPKMLLSAWLTSSLAILKAAAHANYRQMGIERRLVMKGSCHR